VAVLEIDDRETGLDHAEGPRHVHAQIVGASMREGRGHAFEETRVGAAVLHQDAADTAHAQPRPKLGCVMR